MPTARSTAAFAGLPSRRLLLTLSGLVVGLMALGHTAFAASRTASTTEPLSADGLVGKKLRVIHPEQAITMDYSEDRVNVEVDGSDKVKRIFIG